MIEPKGRAITINEILEDLETATAYFRKIMLQTLDKKPSEYGEEILMYSPDEWEIITIALLYEQTIHKEYVNASDQSKWLKDNDRMLALLRDILMKMYDRVDKYERKEA